MNDAFHFVTTIKDRVEENCDAIKRESLQILVIVVGSTIRQITTDFYFLIKYLKK